MDPIAPISAARNRLWLPRLSLASCVRAVMGRDTRGVALTDLQRFNHFPATPLCTISWWFTGSSELLPAELPPTLDAPRQALAGPVLFSGPFTRPTASWCPGPVHGMMLLLMPDALHALIGLEARRFVNGFARIEDVLPPDWQRMCADVQALPDDDDDARVRLIEDFLDPRWQRARPRQALAAHRYADWAQGLALRAATSGPGRSLRQVERRIKQWAGLPLRDLQGISRAERTFFRVAELAGREREVAWGQMAADAGYADQSHLCRETRRVTGFSPREVYRGVECDERFWAYRLWT